MALPPAVHELQRLWPTPEGRGPSFTLLHGLDANPKQALTALHGMSKAFSKQSWKHNFDFKLPVEFKFETCALTHLLQVVSAQQIPEGVKAAQVPSAESRSGQKRRREDEPSVDFSAAEDVGGHVSYTQEDRAHHLLLYCKCTEK